MNKEQRKQRFSLAMLYSLVVFGILILSIAVAAVAIYILVRTGVISGTDDSPLEVGAVILFMSLVSVLVGIILALFTSRIPLKPINTLITQMNRLASGDFKARLSFGRAIKSVPAFLQAAESFNKMAEELENTEMLRSDFINNFSHEFKTPIVSIAGFAKLLKRGNLTAQQRAEYIDIIEEESLRLAYMATNVLNLTRVENQTILTDVSYFNLSEQLRSCVLLLENKWTDKNLEFILELAEYQITANEEMLKQVWINLIDNAIKFTPDYGTVELKISETDTHLSVNIVNIGSEIAPENQKRIFNKFYQSDESHTAEGNGVGLAIVKRIIELHSGTVSVCSENNITTFTVELPKKQ